MNLEEVLALRKAFNSVKARQGSKKIANFEKRKLRLKKVREESVGNGKLLDTAVKNLKANGISVHLAAGKNDALEILLRETEGENVIVKSKSNVSKEIELTKTLEKSGRKVIETDIGDRILQLLEAKPSHPTGPVTHMTAKEIAKGLSAVYNRGIGDDPFEIVRAVRDDVISNLKIANTGITGANAITAEEGAVVLTHNEGNIFEVMKKRKHIIVTSIDKVYPDIEEALNMLKILSFNATGSLIPSFVEILSSASKTADVEKKFFPGVHNPEEVCVIIIDNKRRELIEKGFGNILHCIGCGNCLLHCPMYNTIGIAYAEDNNLGGKGLAYNTLYEGSINKKLEYCLSCGKCRENCPLRINIPKIIRELRSNNISSEIFYFLKSHTVWIYYNLFIMAKEI